MAFKKTKGRPSVAGKKVAEGSRIATTQASESGAPSKTGTPHLERPAKGSGRARAATRGAAARDAAAPGGAAPGAAAPGGASAGTPLGAPAGSRTFAKSQKPKAKKSKGISRRFLIITLSIIAALAIVTGLLAWNQWFRYDDAADIQGTWVIDRTQDTITITPTDMQMTAEVSYQYSLDTFDKTITFNFKQYSGEGSYAFSPDRTTLIITETDADTGENVSTKLVKQQ